MKDGMDINAGTIGEATEAVEEVGQHISEEVREAAPGKLIRAETFGYDSFAVYRRDSRLDALLGISSCFMI